MREILFRGMPYKEFDFGEIGIIKKDEFIYGNLLVNKGKPYIKGMFYKPSMIDYIQLKQWIPVRPKTVGQFTGLLDANGEQIFEGDLLRFEDDEYVVEWNQSDGAFEMNCVDVFVNHARRTNFSTRWCVDNTPLKRRNCEWAKQHDLKTTSYCDSTWFEIIGNIHDKEEKSK